MGTLQRNLNWMGSLLFALLMATQVQAGGVNVDSLFAEARQIARQGDRQRARQICLQILDAKPHYADVRIYLGRLYAWDKQYDAARRELMRVLSERPNNREALNALIDVAYWSGETDQALTLVNRALKTYPNDQKLLLKKARFLIKLNRPREASAPLNRVLERDPSNADALRLMERIKSAARLNKLSVKYSYDQFDRPGSAYGPWHLGVVELSRRTILGSVFVRANYAKRKFGTTPKDGFQYEMDAYPKFAGGVYSYLNIGYSKDAVFPEWRFGGELYASLPASFELSAGLRHLRFNRTNVTIYTGTLGKYYKNYWASFRPFISFKNVGTSFSGNLLIRRYFGNADNYLNLRLGFGSSPVEVSTLQELQRLDSRQVSLLWQKLWGHSVITRLEVGFEREEYRVTKYGNRYTLKLDLQQRF